MNQAPAHAEENPKPVRRRFRPATPNESAIPLPAPELSPKEKDLRKLLPNWTLKALAAGATVPWINVSASSPVPSSFGWWCWRWGLAGWSISPRW